MTSHTIQDVHELPDAMPVLDLTATVTHITERKSGTSNYGPWSIQFLILEDDTGKISVMAKDRPEDFAELDWIGKQVVISAHKSDKHGWQGALAHDNDYKDKNNPERVIKLTKTGQLELAEGEWTDPEPAPASHDETPHRNGGPKDASAATSTSTEAPRSTAPSPDTPSKDVPTATPSSDSASKDEAPAPADRRERLTLAEFLSLTSTVYERCAEVAEPAQSALLTSMIMEQVARGRVELTEDEHLRMLLALNAISVEQFCEFINVTNDQHHDDLATISSKIKRAAIERLQTDPIRLIEKMQEAITYVPAETTFFAELQRLREREPSTV